MREPETTFVPSTDAVEVAVHDYGGDGHPTVFVHGTGLVSRMWEPVMELLGDEFRPIGVDLRGHGSARAPQDVQFQAPRMVSDLTAVIDAFELEDAWIVAHSMGGGTSILASLERPAAFERQWVFEPIIFRREEVRPEGAIDFIEITRRRRPVFDSREQVISSYGSRPPLDELDPACLAAYVEHGFVDQTDGTVRLACDPLMESRAFEQYLQDGWERLPDVALPVRVAYGTASDDRPAAAAPDIAARLPHGDLEAFDGSGHFGCFGPLEHCATSIRSWFSG